MPLKKECQPLTAFTYEGRQYMFARAPFGLKPLTSIFQRGMSTLFYDLDYMGNYVDDILIASDTIDQHIMYAKTVITCLTEAQLIINQEKSKFLLTRVLLLGFNVDANGMSINVEKIANVQDWTI